MRHARLLICLALFVVAAWLLQARPLFAQAPAAPRSGPSRGALTLTTATGGAGPVELAARDGAWVGEVLLKNVGAEPLAVSRLALRGDEDDVRAPAKLAVRFAEGGGTTATLAPGASRKVTVTWTPDRDARVHQAFAHVVVTSSDEAAGEVAMGVHAQLPRGFGPVTDHALSWLVLLPLLAAAFAVVTALRGHTDDGLLRKVAVGACAAQCVLAVWACGAFDGDMTRIDGNDGYQLVERVVWVRALGVEYFVGVDGTSIPLVLLTAVLGLVGVLAASSVERRVKGFYAFYMVLLAGIMGALVALDLVLFVVCWQAVLVPLYFLLGAWGGERREQAAAKTLLFTVLGSGLMLFAVLALYANTDRTFLVDGTTVTHTFAVPELMRVAFHAKHASLFGMPLVKVAWVCLFLSFAVVLPVFPLHRWLPDALVAAPTPVAIVLVGLVLRLGAYGIARMCFGVLPEASRWAAGTVVALGVVNVVYFGLCAMAQSDLKKMYAYASMSQAGFCLIGLGSLTPQGIAGCAVQMVGSGVLGALMVLLLDGLFERVRTREIGRIAGLGREVPMYAALLGVAAFASLGMPGLVGFWGEVLPLFGAFPLHKALTVAAALGVALTATYHMTTLHALLFGEVPRALRDGPALAPFSGKIPEITARELAMAAPLVVLVVLLGVWPSPLLSLIAGGVRDLTALVNPPGPDQIADLFF